ncbi:MAG: hypothetical protein IPI31_09100 [Bacteroidetes bacterium]|jgi:hypothetical protein|nr:hypothetical protein [Bacteroidota bacterium]MBK7567969.1 hypothetical protein [Bacteroidota bacterium]MBP9796774.1 hypothetical protein [Chitinophagales bacterium]
MKKLLIKNKLAFIFLLICITAISSCILFKNSEKMNYIITYPLAIIGWVVFFILVRKGRRFEVKKDDLE